MPNKPNDADVQLSAWNQELVFDRTKRAALNRDSLDITLDQMKQLYVLLYPYIQADFKHRDDIYRHLEDFKKHLNTIIADFNTKLTQLKVEIDTHTHFSAAPGSPTTPPVSPSTLLSVQSIGFPDTETIPYNEASSGHVSLKVVSGSHPTSYYKRNVLANKFVNTQASKPAPSIETLLSKGARVFTPFDVGERDSVLDSKTNQLESKGIGDL